MRSTKSARTALAFWLLPAVCAAQQKPSLPSSLLEPVHEGEEVRFGTTVVIPSGLRGDIYDIPTNTQALPKFKKLQPVGTIYTSALNIPPRNFREGFPGVTNRIEWFAIDYTGRFYIDNPGKYHFLLFSDDGSKLYIDGRVVIKNDGLHGPLRADGIVNLAGGIHTIRLSYFQGPGLGIALILGVSGPGDTDFRVFNTNEFKPPSNPDNWKFGKPGYMKTK